MQSDTHRHSHRRENHKRRLRAAALILVIGIIMGLVALFFWVINNPDLIGPR
jgi:hypothetical protein